MLATGAVRFYDLPPDLRARGVRRARRGLVANGADEGS